MDHTAVLSNVSTVEEKLSQQLAPRRFETSLVSLFSFMALLLASVGIYGVMHYGGPGNGPTYNSYGQSFQYNPSMPRPFAPRGGFAPGRGMGGFGGRR